MSSDIERLNKELQDKIAALDKQRREDSERFSKEREERRFLEESERAERVRVERAKQAEHLRRKDQEQKEREQRIQQETSERLERERIQNENEELNRKLHEQYEYIKAQIAKVEFAEEQHQQSLAAGDLPLEAEEVTTEISVEHPAAPLNTVKPGEAVSGTEGDTPSTPLMSQHLKHILRQAGRNY